MTLPIEHPIDVVRAQVDAFNRHHLEDFLATYAEDAEVTGSTVEPLQGRSQLRAFYGQRLSDSSLRCELRTVLLLGERWVVAHEAVATAESVTEVVALFDVVDGLIRRASFTKA